MPRVIVIFGGEMKTITVEDVTAITPLSENEALKFISDNLD